MNEKKRGSLRIEEIAKLSPQERNENLLKVCERRVRRAFNMRKNEIDAITCAHQLVLAIDSCIEEPLLCYVRYLVEAAKFIDTY